ncbi:hypothetical protein ACSFB8_04300 [Enterococcus faecalis]
MTVSNIIQLVGIVASFTLSAVAIWQAQKSIKLTEKSIINSNRPYVVCYLAMSDVGFFEKYFIIKNFGHTPAKILKIKSSRKISSVGENLYLQSLVNTIIAPTQKFVTALYSEDDVKNELIDIEIIYEDTLGKTYQENFQLNPNFTRDIAYHNENLESLSADQNDLRNILHALSKSTL